MQPPPPDTISNDGGFASARRQPRWRRPAAGVKTTALTTAVSLVLAGGVATAAYRASGSGTDPTTLIPSSAFAVAVVDLGLSGGQDDALREFADHFPGSPTRTGSGSAVDRLLRPLLHDSQPPTDYDRDIKPWLGDHVAVAGWFDSTGKPQLEVLVQTTDLASAKTHIRRLMAHDAGGGVAYADGYAVLAQTSALAGEAVRAAHSRSLADAGTFAGDVGKLPSGDPLVGWVDGAGAMRAVRAALGSGFGSMLGGAGPGSAFGLSLGTLEKNAARERVAAGVRFTDDTAQLDVLQFGGPAAHLGDSSLLTRLPDNTIAALQIGDPGSVVTRMTGMLGLLGSAAAMGVVAPFAAQSQACFGSSVAPVPVQRVPASVLPPGTPHRRALLRQLRAAERRARRQQRLAVRAGQSVARPPTPMTNGSAGYSSSCTTVSPPPSPLKAFSTATGLTLPGDLQTLLGDDAVVAYGGVRIGALPDIAVRSHPADLGAAQSVADRLQSTLARRGLAQVGVQAAGGDLVVATPADYAAQVAQTGSLGRQPQVRSVLGTVPAKVSAAGYVDLTRIWPLLGSHVPTGLTHIHALGFWAGVDGAVQHLQLRVLVG